MKIDLFGLPTKTIVFLLGFATCNMGCSDEVVIKEVTILFSALTRMFPKPTFAP